MNPVWPELGLRESIVKRECTKEREGRVKKKEIVKILVPPPPHNIRENHYLIFMRRKNEFKTKRNWRPCRVVPFRRISMQRFGEIFRMWGG
jgi:hypothetical protein